MNAEIKRAADAGMALYEREILQLTEQICRFFSVPPHLVSAGPRHAIDLK